MIINNYCLLSLLRRFPLITSWAQLKLLSVTVYLSDGVSVAVWGQWRRRAIIG